jgi:hypothetical protein
MANARIVNTPSQAIAQSGTTHTQKTVSSTAVAMMASALNANTSHVLFQVTGANVRATFDGTDPTTSLGFIYVDGTTGYLTKSMATACKMIRDDSTDAVIEIQQLNYL